MKKITALALSALLIIGALMLGGCSKTPQNEPSDDISENDSANTNLPSPDSGESGKPTDPSASDTDTDTDAADDESSADEKFDIALSMIGENVSALYEAIGEPADSSYASSCMGKGEDGELYYDGFTVCTYLEDGVETVVDVYK